MLAHVPNQPQPDEGNNREQVAQIGHVVICWDAIPEKAAPDHFIGVERRIDGQGYLSQWRGQPGGQKPEAANYHINIGGRQPDVLDELVPLRHRGDNQGNSDRPPGLFSSDQVMG